MKKITKNMTIAQVIIDHPIAEEILQKHLGHCTSCPAASMETIALGAHLHEKDADEIVKELNMVLEDNNKEKK
ncbi:DUF1858 domain-containing protein [bacterium]|nr:DUF1858 domain-containing protein [bacterium]